MEGKRIMIEEVTGVLRNLLAPLKISEDKKADHVSMLVDQAFLEAYTVLCKKKGVEVEMGGSDPLEVSALTVHDLMAKRFELDEIVEALTFSVRILTLRFLEQSKYDASDMYMLSKSYLDKIKNG